MFSLHMTLRNGCLWYQSPRHDVPNLGVTSVGTLTHDLEVIGVKWGSPPVGDGNSSNGVYLGLW